VPPIFRRPRQVLCSPLIVTTLHRTVIREGHITGSMIWCMWKWDQCDGKPEREGLAWRRCVWVGSHVTRRTKRRLTREWHKGLCRCRLDTIEPRVCVATDASRTHSDSHWKRTENRKTWWRQSIIFRGKLVSDRAAHCLDWYYQYDNGQVLSGLLRRAKASFERFDLFPTVLTRCMRI
jgi:hypothetical protein